MLLHDSYFLSTNKSLNTTHYGTITVAYSPLFHSTFTLIISLIGLLLNLICCIKIWFIIYVYRKQKQNNLEQSNESKHILSHKKYRFLFILTSNNILLCLSSIISCFDEKFFFQSFLARHHLCAAEILIWKFTLHFIPLLIIGILSRYHYIFKKNFQIKSSNLSTLNQLLCTDLCIIIPFVLALAWSVDGLWLWGVTNIKDYVMLSSTPSPSIKEIQYQNDNYSISIEIYTNHSLINTKEFNDDNLYLPEQKIICYLQTNHNFHFTVRLLHLIQADFLLLFSLHLIGLILEIILHIRLCCCLNFNKLTLSFNQERQLCLYILYIFILITLTSLPFYFHRTIEIIFDIQLITINNEYINSRIFAQILLIGISIKPLLFFILFFPSSILFKLKCYLKCYSPINIQLIDQNEQLLSLKTNENLQQRQSLNGPKRHCYSLFVNSSYQLKLQSKPRTQSYPILTTTTTTNQRQESLSKSEHINNWLKLTNSIINDSRKDRSNIGFA